MAMVTVLSDTTLAALSLHGYLGTISYGYNDVTNGDEFSACAPLEIVGQTTDNQMMQGLFLTTFVGAGVFDMMGYDRASAAYIPDSDDTDTVKTILTTIANATLAPFTHCKAYTITFDSEDSLIDAFIPADFFSVSLNESRLSAFKKAIAWTKCKARIEDDGEIHVFDPTVSGASYNYEFNDAVTNHNFFRKSVRERLVLPSQFIVSTPADVYPAYTGTASDTATNTALGRYHTSYRNARATSNAQCALLATALLQHAQVAAEKGSGEVPMNCGQEVMDYIKITDSIASDTRTGNIGYIKRSYAPGQYLKMNFGFGTLAQEMPTGLLGEGAEGGATWEALNALRDYFYFFINGKDDILIDMILGMQTTIRDAEMANLRVTETLQIPGKAP